MPPKYANQCLGTKLLSHPDHSRPTRRPTRSWPLWIDMQVLSCERLKLGYPQTIGLPFAHSNDPMTSRKPPTDMPKPSHPRRWKLLESACRGSCSKALVAAHGQVLWAQWSVVIPPSLRIPFWGMGRYGLFIQLLTMTTGVENDINLQSAILTLSDLNWHWLMEPLRRCRGNCKVETIEELPVQKKQLVNSSSFLPNPCHVVELTDCSSSSLYTLVKTTEA